MNGMADLSKRLLPQEKMSLAECEAVIERGLNTFFAVGDALNAIKHHKYYRDKHDSFQDYCKDRWGIGRSRSYQLIDAARVIREMQESTRVEIFPTSEKQIRSLCRLDTAEQRIDAWNQAVRNAGGKPTPREVILVIDHFVGPKSPKVKPVTRVAPVDEMEWTELMEKALLSLPDNGMVKTATGMRCVVGCRIYSDAREYQHHPDCILGQALGVLKIMKSRDGDMDNNDFEEVVRSEN